MKGFYNFTPFEIILILIILVLLIIIYKLQRKSDYDFLTGIRNRAKCVSDLKRLKGKGYAIFLDVDALRDVNNRFGHWAGDKLLTSTVEHVKKCILKIGRVYRIGGDEFLVFIKTKDETKVKEVLNKILDTPVIYFNDYEYKIGISMGCCFYYDFIKDIETLFYVTDSVLYEVKESTRNAWKLIDEKEVKKWIEIKEKNEKKAHK